MRTGLKFQYVAGAYMAVLMVVGWVHQLPPDQTDAMFRRLATDGERLLRATSPSAHFSAETPEGH